MCVYCMGVGTISYSAAQNDQKIEEQPFVVAVVITAVHYIVMSHTKTAT